MSGIREATEKDLEAINNILKTNGQIPDVTSSDIKCFLVAEIEDKLVGCGMLRDYKDGVELSKISVLPDYQGRGYGMEIAMTLLGRTKGQKCWLLSVDSHSFWELFGFSIIPEEEEPREFTEQCHKCDRWDNCNRVVMVRESS